MPDQTQHLAVTLFSELLAVDQLARASMARVLPKGMELSHFSVLNHLAHSGAERTPAQLAQTFHLTRGAMTNTLSKLEWAGWVHVRPDWDDARRKLVSISPSGLSARNAAIAAIIAVGQRSRGEGGRRQGARDIAGPAGVAGEAVGSGLTAGALRAGSIWKKARGRRSLPVAHWASLYLGSMTAGLRQAGFVAAVT